MEEFILWLLYKASLKALGPKGRQFKRERVHLRKLAQSFRAQHQNWYNERLRAQRMEIV